MTIELRVCPFRDLEFDHIDPPRWLPGVHILFVFLIWQHQPVARHDWLTWL